MCDIYIPATAYFAHQLSENHKAKCCKPLDVDNVFIVDTAFNNRIATYRLPISYQTLNYETFLEDVRPKVMQLIESSICQHRLIKVNFEIYGNYFLQRTGEYSIKSFNTKQEVVTTGSKLDDIYNHFTETMITKTKEFNENKSGKIVKKKCKLIPPMHKFFLQTMY